MSRVVGAFRFIQKKGPEAVGSFCLDAREVPLPAKG